MSVLSLETLAGLGKWDSHIEVWTQCERADVTVVSLADEIAGPAGLSDGDCGGITNGPPHGFPGKKSRLSQSTLMRRLNEAAETV